MPVNEEILKQRMKDLCHAFSELNIEINESNDISNFGRHIRAREDIKRLFFENKKT